MTHGGTRWSCALNYMALDKALTSSECVGCKKTQAEENG